MESLILSRKIPAVFMRGGTSKAIIFHRKHLPEDQSEWDCLFLGIMGSPDPNGRQLNGMGGGISSLSKVCIVGPSSRPDTDVDYTFAQVAIRDAVVDYSGNCGNMSSAIGPFAVDEGLVDISGSKAVVRIHNTNTGKVIVSEFAVANGRALEEGSFVIPGVAGSGAPIRLIFQDPGGANTGHLLPSGNPVDDLDVPGYGKIEVSLVDSTAPCVFLEAAALGLSACEGPSEMGKNKTLMELFERMRQSASIRMGLAKTSQEARNRIAIPRIAVVASAHDSRLLSGKILSGEDCDLIIRMISVGQPHLAVPITGALCVAVASRIEGTVVHRVSRQTSDAYRSLRIGHPSGVTVVEAKVERSENSEWQAHEAVVWRTARRLMEGAILVPLREKT
jgi:2-methylaconitate cis-trans-isomerase PrpF